MKSFIVPMAVLSVLSLLSRVTFAADATFVETAVNGTTVLVVGVDSSQVEISPKLISLLETGSLGNAEDVVSVVKKSLSEAKESMQGEKGYFAFDLPYSVRPQARMVTSSKVTEANFLKLTKVWPMAVGKPNSAAGWRTVALSSSEEGLSTPTILSDWMAPQSSEWQAAMEANANSPVQLVVVPPSYFRKTIAELDSELPDRRSEALAPLRETNSGHTAMSGSGPGGLGGGSAKTLLGGVEWVSLGLDPNSLELKVIVQADSVETAQAIKSHLPKLFAGLAAEASLDKASSIMLQAILDLMQPRVHESQVILSLQAEQADALLQMATFVVNAAGQPIAASQTHTKLKHFGLGVHNYFHRHKHLPTYHKMEKSKGLSWRVHILPFIDQEDLYKEFHLDESWDSPHNLRLLDRMPDLFKPVIPPGSKETVKPNHTTFVAPIGKDTVFGQDKVVGFEHITDGTSNTVMFVEVKLEHAIPWTSPEEYRFDPADPAAKLRSIREHVSLATMDGAVHQVRADQPKAFWNAAFSRNGSEVVSFK